MKNFSKKRFFRSFSGWNAVNICTKKKLDLRFWTDLNPGRGMSEVSMMRNSYNGLYWKSSLNHFTKAIHDHQTMCCQTREFDFKKNWLIIKLCNQFYFRVLLRMYPLVMILGERTAKLVIGWMSYKVNLIKFGNRPWICAQVQTISSRWNQV